MYLCAKREPRSWRRRSHPFSFSGFSEMPALGWAVVGGRSAAGQGARTRILKSVTQPGLETAVEAAARVPVPGSRPNRPNRDPLRPWRCLSRGEGSRRVAARASGCGMRMRPLACSRTAPTLGTADAGWLLGSAAHPITHLHSCQATGTEL